MFGGQGPNAGSGTGYYTPNTAGLLYYLPIHQHIGQSDILLVVNLPLTLRVLFSGMLPNQSAQQHQQYMANTHQYPMQMQQNQMPQQNYTPQGQLFQGQMMPQSQQRLATNMQQYPGSGPMFAGNIQTGGIPQMNMPQQQVSLS